MDVKHILLPYSAHNTAAASCRRRFWQTSQTHQDLIRIHNRRFCRVDRPLPIGYVFGEHSRWSGLGSGGKSSPRRSTLTGIQFAIELMNLPWVCRRDECWCTHVQGLNLRGYCMCLTQIFESLSVCLCLCVWWVGLGWVWVYRVLIFGDWFSLAVFSRESAWWIKDSCDSSGSGADRPFVLTAIVHCLIYQSPSLTFFWLDLCYCPSNPSLSADIIGNLWVEGSRQSPQSITLLID